MLNPFVVNHGYPTVDPLKLHFTQDLTGDPNR